MTARALIRERDLAAITRVANAARTTIEIERDGVTIRVIPEVNTPAPEQRRGTPASLSEWREARDEGKALGYPHRS